MPRQPHVLILMTDQQRADCLSCTGHPQLKTPHMDRLAAEGVRFAQATTVSPVCMSARASLASGVYPHNHGISICTSQEDKKTQIQQISGDICVLHASLKANLRAKR